MTSLKFTPLLFLALIHFSETVCAQTVKTGDGESSVLFDETTVGIDLGKSELSFTTNNYAASKDTSHGWLWGVMLKGKHKEGLSSILSSSELIPSSSIQFNLGYFSSPEEDIRQYKPNRWNSLEQKRDDLTTFLEDSLFIQIDRLIRKDTTSKATGEEKQELIDLAKKVLKTPVAYSKLKEDLSELTRNLAKSKEFKNLTGRILKYLNQLQELNDLTKVGKDLKKLTGEAFQNISKKPYKKLTIYGFLELNREKFKTFNGWDPDDISDSFSKIEFDGSRIGLGAGCQFGGNIYVGGRVFYEHTNNTSVLTSNEYEYEQTNTAGNETYTLKDNVTAYSGGTYGELNVVGIDLDLIRFMRLGKKGFLILDAYSVKI